MSNWQCYLLMSLDSNCTYIGSSVDPSNRLKQHNNANPSIKRKGAKYTRGQTWVPILTIQNFKLNTTCLSFEAGWKKLSKTRNSKKLHLINQMTGLTLAYGSDTKYNRIIDLLYFVYNITYIGSKFMINYNTNHPVICACDLTINIFMEDWIADLPWPHFVNFNLNCEN